jgi:uncharacterized protein
MKSSFILIALLFIFAFGAHADTIKQIVAGAYSEVSNETEYNAEMLEKYFPPTYKNGVDTGRSVYPNGDVNPKEGICADLVVRALRNAGIDLQKSVHLDILSNKKAYGVQTPDRYIDQRRVWILKTYFQRNWKSLSVSLDNPNNWQPGDIVVWDVGSKQHLHIGIIGNKKRSDGFPYVIHNMSYIPFIFTGKTVEQDILEGPELFWNSVGQWKIIGHYRNR